MHWQASVISVNSQFNLSKTRVVTTVVFAPWHSEVAEFAEWRSCGEGGELRVLWLCLPCHEQYVFCNKLRILGGSC